jgi:hypothetical protein
MNPYLEGNPYLIKKEPNQAGRQALSLALQLYYLKNQSGTKTPRWKIGDTKPGEPLNIPTTTVEPEGLDAFVFGKGGEQALVPETAMETDLSAFNFGEKAETLTEGLDAFNFGTGETLTEGLSAFDFGMEEAAAGSAAELGSLDAFTFGGGVEGLSAFELGGGASGGYTFGGGVEPFVVDSSLSLGAEAGAGEAGAGSAAGSGGGGASLGVILALIKLGMMTKDYMAPYAEGGARERGGLVGYLANASQTPVNSVLTPGQAFVDAGWIGKDTAFGKFVGFPGRIEKTFMDKLSNLCIIISACTSRNSYEVNITRQFRDRYMDEEELTGYYTLCIVVVPFIKKYPLFKRIVRKVLVDRLVDYGEWRLDMKQDMKDATSGVVKKMFLGLCRHIGQGVDTVLGQEV